MPQPSHRILVRAPFPSRLVCVLNVCYLLNCTGPICTSNPFPTDSDRTESKYKFKTYTVCVVFVYACGYILSLDLSGGTSPSVPSEESVAFAKLTHVQISNLLAMFYIKSLR